MCNNFPPQQMCTSQCIVDNYSQCFHFCFQARFSTQGCQVQNKFLRPNLIFPRQSSKRYHHSLQHSKEAKKAKWANRFILADGFKKGQMAAMFQLHTNVTSKALCFPREYERDGEGNQGFDIINF